LDLTLALESEQMKEQSGYDLEFDWELLLGSLSGLLREMDWGLVSGKQTKPRLRKAQFCLIHNQYQPNHYQRT
jgi:hypothetical protein